VGIVGCGASSPQGPVESIVYIYIVVYVQWWPTRGYCDENVGFEIRTIHMQSVGEGFVHIFGADNICGAYIITYI